MTTNMRVSPSELNRAGAWIQEKLFCPEALPYSFVYGGQRIAAQPDGWSFEKVSSKLDEHRTEYTTILADPATGLTVTCTAVQNYKYAAVEWTLWFENTGDVDTPVLSDIRAVDADIFIPENVSEKSHRSPITLYHFKGDACTPDGYEPLEHLFYGDVPLTLHPEGGDPCNVAFPYYRMQREGDGTIFVVSWQGQWEATFQPVVAGRGHKGGLHVTAGQQLVHAKLLPGERIRTPMIVLMPYDGNDGVRAQNLWRRWFIEFNMPRPGGKRLEPLSAFHGSGIFKVMLNATEENQKQYIDRMADNGVDVDYLWMDAGWYEDARGEWPNIGTWKPDPIRFPNGIRAVSDHAHARGLKTLLWFEPERVKPDTELYRDHPEWLLNGYALDLGNSDAREWITNRINALIRSEALDVYRQDHNFRPLAAWRTGEPEDRQGIRENHHCTGYLQFWDDILAANPGILIDSCASGGRRNDLETMRRAVPFTRSDYHNVLTESAMHHTLFQWIPYFGSTYGYGTGSDDRIYDHRIARSLSFHGYYDVFQTDFDFARLAAWMREWRETAHCLYGDFYPLTPYSRDEREWIGWQFHLPESNEGVLQVFMKSAAPYRTAAFQLRGLDPDADYDVKDYNTGDTCRCKGIQLMEEGIEVVMEKRPDSACFHYVKA